MALVLLSSHKSWVRSAVAQDGALEATTQATAIQDGTTQAQRRVYIAVGDPNVRKVLTAIDRTEGAGNEATLFYNTLASNLLFTDLFEPLPEARFPSRRGGMSAASIDFSQYRALGVEFLVKSALRINSGVLEAEVRLFDVNRGLQIMGKLYPLQGKVANPARELAHFAGNDLLEELTGIPGIFRTRILMSCGEKPKEIYMMDFDGQNIRKLTDDRNFTLSPNWSWDGKRIVFTSYKPATKGGMLNPNLYMYEPQTGARRVVSAAQGLNTGAAFHPNNTQLAYTFSTGNRAEIYLFDLLANTRKRLTQTLFFSVEPSWAPDGNRLVFSSSRSGRPHVFISDANGGNWRQLTFAGRYNSSPHWSPMGDKIAFAGQENQGNNFNIFMIDPSGSNLVRLTNDASSSNERPYFSPDGRFIAFASNRDGLYRVHVMTNRGTNIRVLSPRELGHCKQPAWSPRL